jgi:hypothetical protein
MALTPRPITVQSPHLRESDVEVTDKRFGALLEHGMQPAGRIERKRYVRNERRDPDALILQFLRAFPLFDFLLQLEFRLAKRVLNLFLGDSVASDSGSALFIQPNGISFRQNLRTWCYYGEAGLLAHWSFRPARGMNQTGQCPTIRAGKAA